MIYSTRNPEISDTCKIVARSNGIHYSLSHIPNCEWVWPVRVKMHPNGVLSILPKKYGVCKYNDDIVYDFSYQSIGQKSNQWQDIVPSDKFYAEFKKIYEINQTRTMKRKAKEEDLEFKRTLTSVDNDFTEQEFMEHLLTRYNIMLFFKASHEVAKVYWASTKHEYCVKLNNYGTPYYARKYGNDTKTIRVQSKLGEIKLSGKYTWETMCDIVNKKLIKEITVDELKKIIEAEKVKEAV